MIHRLVAGVGWGAGTVGGSPATFSRRFLVRATLVLIVLLCASLCYGQAIDPDPVPPPPVEKPKPPDPVKPPPISVNVPPACCCAVGDACGCAPGHCHCASAQWFETPGTNGDQFGLFKGNRQVGSYRRSDGVFLPLLGDSWGKAQKPPIAPPGRGSGVPVQSVPQYRPQQQSFFPQIRSGGRSGGC